VASWGGGGGREQDYPRRLRPFSGSTGHYDATKDGSSGSWRRKRRRRRKGGGGGRGRGKREEDKESREGARMRARREK